MKATNQNRGATTMIKSSDVARCTRQCASSGSPQPFFWSLPIAIQEFCSMKSAMMCFTVRSNIHPTSAATGTDDDMEGNNKQTPFAGTDEVAENRGLGCQRNFVLEPGRTLPLFMASPGEECTCGWFEKIVV